MPRKLLILPALALLFASPLSAQSWTVDLELRGGRLAVARTSGIDVGTNTALADADTARITIRCSGVSCIDVKVMRKSGTLVREIGPTGTPTATSREVLLPATFVQKVDPPAPDKYDEILFVTGTDTAVERLHVYRGVAATPPATGRGINDVPELACYRNIPLLPDGYDAASNNAQFVVTPVGNVLVRPGGPLDENDHVTVYVVGDAEVLRSIAVTRKSAFRTVGGVNLLGGGDLDALADLIRQSTRTAKCTVFAASVSDFASGRAEVELAAIGSNGRTPLGSFDFAVNPLYTGAFSLGPVFSWVEDRKFRLLANPAGGDSIVSVSEEDSPRLHYVLAYTPFIWGRRDIEKPVPFHQHFNPVVAITLEDVLDNGFLGISGDFLNASIHVLGGIHVRQRERLDPESGLEEGATFRGSSDRIPTLNEWTGAPFLGATVDLRAAVKLLGGVLKGAT